MHEIKVQSQSRHICKLGCGNLFPLHDKNGTPVTRIPSPWIRDTRVCTVSGCLNAKYPGSGQLGRKEQQHLNTHVSSRRNQTRRRDSASGSLLPSPSGVEPYRSHAARRCCVEENPSNRSRSHLCLWRPVVFCWHGFVCLQSH